MREAGEYGDDASQPFGFGRGIEAEPDVVGQFELDSRAGHRVAVTPRGVKAEWDNQGRLSGSG
jgi:hypothetical protein